ncbi:MAG: LysE family transporter [Dehalococcoidales bacterium]|jgi:threonine/homoserine/homoserine lactone efflux protein|nr:LysE family transporter [Dehalococcoidales bacterium]|tara:strand:- start:1558 stop:2169 length:612 start_codon:yes stop_codon:yes gene_type:complete
MLPILLSVVVISFSGVMMPGPMFAITLAKSFKSPWAGVWISLGHAVIEVPLIVLIYLGFSRFFENSLVQLVLSLAGGSMVIWLGIAMFRARAKVVKDGKELSYSAFTAGIITSGLNPFFLLWWATIGSLLVMRFLEFGLSGLIVFIVVHWLIDLLWLSFVSILVYRTHSLWGNKFQQWVFIAISLTLVGFGAWFLISGVRMVV